MKKNWFKGFVAVLAAAVLMMGATGGASKRDAGSSKADADREAYGFTPESAKLQIGFVTVGPVSDWGFNYSQNQGRLYLESKLGDKIKTVIVENIPESADVERVMQKLIRTGGKVLFPTSFGYLDPALRVAALNPEVIIMHTGGYKLSPDPAGKPLPNFGTFTAYLDEPFYLAGIVAGRMTKSRKIGFVAAQTVPPVVREINAITLGARSVNPEVKVHVVWTGSWADPAKETQAANALADLGCDVLTCHQDSPMAVVRAAENRGIYSIGVHADCSAFAPKGWLTGAEWNWGPFMEKIVMSIMDKTWKPEMLRGGIHEGYVKLSRFGVAVPASVREEVLGVQDKILKDGMKIFTGPIKDVEGTVRIPEGKSASFGEIEGMNWFVEGVKGSIK